MGIIDLNFRMLPVPVRLKTGLEALAELMGNIGDESVKIGELKSSWTWSAERCPHCWRRQVDEPACQFPVGLLQEFFSWASSGRAYKIREIECKAAGGAVCLIHIDKKALD